MRLYADNGERTLALKQYQTCCDVLAADLGVVPEPKTEKLAQAIRTGAESATEDTGSDPGARATEPEALSLPDIPSIAVLPFTNLSTEPEQEYFADGIADDIITTLSKIPKLFIVARDSTFTYRGQSIDVKQVGREQGVRYVGAGHRPVDRRHLGPSSLGRALRLHTRRHLQSAGRHNKKGDDRVTSSVNRGRSSSGLVERNVEHRSLGENH
jgi:hypothetical protein